MAKKKIDVAPETVEEAKKKTDVEMELDSNRALRLSIIEQLEKINNRYYLLIIKKYLDNLN